VNSQPELNFKIIYSSFNVPISELDCGELCASHNPNGVPFCCDICHAIPAVYKQEWNYLQSNTDLWHNWRPDECTNSLSSSQQIEEDLPENMLSMACKGVQFCQREFRTIACRQFPFFPYITEDFRFIGMSYEWEFERQCWIISNLDQVSSVYRFEFINTFDELFNQWPEEMESYAIKSEEMRSNFLQRGKRIPILHRNGKNYLLSPKNERLHLSKSQFRRFAPY